MIAPMSMTENEVIKALSICKNGSCANCPLENTEKCLNNLVKNAFLFVNRIQEENQQLKAEIERLNKKAEKVFEATINKVLSMKNLYVIVDNKFVEVEMMEELEYLFGMDFCEFNDDYEENLDNILKELAGDME